MLWFGIGYHHPVMGFLVQLTEPLLAPLRRFVPASGGFDFTPMVALFVLWVLEYVVTRLLLVVL